MSGKNAIVPFSRIQVTPNKRIMMREIEDIPVKYTLPEMPHSLCKVIFDFGKLLIIDDHRDIGIVRSNSHPSWMHHYMLGTAMMLVGQMGGIIQTLSQMEAVAEEAKMAMIEEDFSSVEEKDPGVIYMGKIPTKSQKELPDPNNYSLPPIPV